jgi:hypothetical protein
VLSLHPLLFTRQQLRSCSSMEQPFYFAC